jgi:hypothetical protein
MEKDPEFSKRPDLKSLIPKKYLEKNGMINLSGEPPSEANRYQNPDKFYVDEFGHLMPIFLLEMKLDEWTAKLEKARVHRAEIAVKKFINPSYEPKNDQDEVEATFEEVLISDESLRKEGKKVLDVMGYNAPAYEVPDINASLDNQPKNVEVVATESVDGKKVRDYARTYHTSYDEAEEALKTNV